MGGPDSLRSRFVGLEVIDPRVLELFHVKSAVLRKACQHSWCTQRLVFATKLEFVPLLGDGGLQFGFERRELLLCRCTLEHARECLRQEIKLARIHLLGPSGMIRT